MKMGRTVIQAVQPDPSTTAQQIKIKCCGEVSLL